MFFVVIWVTSTVAANVGTGELRASAVTTSLPGVSESGASIGPVEEALSRFRRKGMSHLPWSE